MPKVEETPLSRGEASHTLGGPTGGFIPFSCFFPYFFSFFFLFIISKLTGKLTQQRATRSGLGFGVYGVGFTLRRVQL